MAISSRRFLLIGVLLACFATAQSIESEPAASNPLAAFERIVGGQWHLEGSFQEFEWGAGKRSVRGRSYFVVDGAPRLVSEGLWYWHPGEQAIKGIFIARDMPVELFEYTTKFEADRMVSELFAYGPAGDRTAYIETWEFAGDTQFTWTLFRKGAEGLQEEMGGVYSRVK